MASIPVSLNGSQWKSAMAKSVASFDEFRIALGKLAMTGRKEPDDSVRAGRRGAEAGKQLRDSLSELDLNYIPFEEDEPIRMIRFRRYL